MCAPQRSLNSLRMWFLREQMYSRNNTKWLHSVSIQVNSDYHPGMDEEPDQLPLNAFFVLEAGRIYPLDQAVTNIGRMLDNHLVFDDPRVSRRHAQVRAIDGHFVLTDLNSTGGIFVNGRRVTETILYPNDSISLAGVTFTFQQDEPHSRPDLAETLQ